jgi:hypothetical protein
LWQKDLATAAAAAAAAVAAAAATATATAKIHHQVTTFAMVGAEKS